MAVVPVEVVMEADQEEGDSEFKVRACPVHCNVIHLNLSTRTRLHVFDPITLIRRTFSSAVVTCDVCVCAYVCVSECVKWTVIKYQRV